MRSEDEIAQLEKVIGQLQGAHAEVSLLAKKAPSDALNKFKIDLINKVVIAANLVLGKDYRPFDHFDHFDFDDAPTTSDVAMILAQYMEEAERYRSDNVVPGTGGAWYYKIDGERSSIRSGSPSKVGRR
jgi:hypothetical protein